MCFDTSRFVDEEMASNFVCSICHDVLCVPQLNKTEPRSKQVEGCGHKYCEKCIKGWVNSNQSCPDCRKKLDFENLKPIDRDYLNILKGLKIHCKYFKEGCEFTSKLEQIEQHEYNDCKFGVKNCIYCKTSYTLVHADRDCIQKLVETIKLKDAEIETKNKEILCLNDDKKLLERRLVDVTQLFEVQQEQTSITIERLEEMLNFNKKELEISRFNYEREIKRLKEVNKELENQVNNAKTKTVMQDLVNLCNSKVNNFERVKQIVANVNLKNTCGNMALLRASFYGHSNIVKLLIDCKVNVNESDNDGLTPLIYASWNGHLETVKLLIENKSNVDERDRYGSTALFYASWSGYLDVVKFLIENNADIDAKNNFGYTPLTIAKECKLDKVFNYISTKTRK